MSAQHGERLALPNDTIAASAIVVAVSCGIHKDLEVFWGIASLVIKNRGHHSPSLMYVSASASSFLATTGSQMVISQSGIRKICDHALPLFEPSSLLGPEDKKADSRRSVSRTGHRFSICPKLRIHIQIAQEEYLEHSIFGLHPYFELHAHQSPLVLCHSCARWSKKSPPFRVYEPVFVQTPTFDGEQNGAQASFKEQVDFATFIVKHNPNQE